MPNRCLQPGAMPDARLQACNMLNELCKNPTPALLGMLDAVCGAAHAIIAAPDTSEMVRKMLMQVRQHRHRFHLRCAVAVLWLCCGCDVNVL